MEGAKARVLEFMAAKGIEKASFYKDTKLSNGYLDKHANINSDKLSQISNAYPDLNLNWVIKGSGPMLLSETSLSRPLAKSLDNAIVTVDTTDNTVIPILDIKVAAGSPTILDEPDYYRALPTFSFPPNLFRSGTMVGMQARGYSMMPTIKQGDYVLGKELVHFDQLRNGEVYIVVYQDHLRAHFFVKRCYFYQGESVIVLSSDNDDYPDEEVELSALLKLYHVEACLTTQLIRASPSLRGQFERLEKRIDKLALHMGA